MKGDFIFQKSLQLIDDMVQSRNDIDANFSNETDSELKFNFTVYKNKIEWKLNQKMYVEPVPTLFKPLVPKKIISRGRPKLAITKCSHTTAKHYA